MQAFVHIMSYFLLLLELEDPTFYMTILPGTYDDDDDDD